MCHDTVGCAIHVVCAGCNVFSMGLVLEFETQDRIEGRTFALGLCLKIEWVWLWCPTIVTE